MTTKYYSSAVELPFTVNIEGDIITEDVVLMKTSAFRASLSTANHSICEEDATKSEKTILLKELDRLKAELTLVDESENKITRSFAISGAKRALKIKEDLAKIIDANKVRSESAMIAARSLFVTANTLKSFFDNCFKCNFM